MQDRSRPGVSQTGSVSGSLFDIGYDVFVSIHRLLMLPRDLYQSVSPQRQNFIEAACSVVMVPCDVCFIPLIPLCPQPLPALCWACSETQGQGIFYRAFTRRRIVGLTKYMQSHDVPMEEFGFRPLEPEGR